MILQERSFSGKLFRPRPEIHCEPNGQLCIIATPWGPRASAKRVIQSITDYLLSARSDAEVTSPFQTIASLSPLANSLRVALMLANDVLYREENRNEYLTGMEIFIAAREAQECAWIQVGGNFVFLDRPGWDMQPLGTAPDLALSLSNSQGFLSPLPQQLLGVSPTSNFAIQSLRVESGDRLVLLQRSLLPARFLALPRGERELNGLSRTLAHQSADMPFWLGLLSFD